VLILTRRIGETVTIGADVTITVVGMKSGQIRLGISAPRDIPVHRQEVFERIHKRHAVKGPHGFAPDSPVRLR